MTVSEMIVAVADLLGLSGSLTSTDAARLARHVNQGKDRVVGATKWPWLETVTTQLFTSGTRLYTPPVLMNAITAIEDSDGNRVIKVERDTYDELFRPSTATATTPSDYALQGVSTTGTHAFHVWPQPSANSSGLLRYLARVPDVAVAGSTGSYEHIPIGLHNAVVMAAKVEFYRQDHDPALAQLAEAEFQSVLGQDLGKTVSPVAYDGGEK